LWLIANRAACVNDNAVRTWRVNIPKSQINPPLSHSTQLNSVLHWGHIWSGQRGYNLKQLIQGKYNSLVHRVQELAGNFLNAGEDGIKN
jgi:hypothetical protein